MAQVKFIMQDHRYNQKGADTIAMCILGYLISSEVGCYESSFKEWAEADKSDPFVGMLIISLVILFI
jgi:hypothetical protein